MLINSYLERIEKSGEYKEFKTKYSDSYLIAGFFVVDFETGNNIHQIDYYIPSTKKIAAFTLSKGISLQILDGSTSKIPEKLKGNTKIDLDALPGIIKDEMRNRSMSEDIVKMIAIIQSVEGKTIWDLSCILSGMELLKSHVEDESKTVLKIERISMLDIIKKIPAATLKQMQGQAADPSTGAKRAPPTKKEAEEEIKKLNELEEKIEEEKTALSKTLGKNESTKVKSSIKKN
ncbi:MAG: hypothetical protein Q7S74_02630 [Nanoarchaeota archaeon]|nr:hypothetical protein [Nanoarchaeota archaeon]